MIQYNNTEEELHNWWIQMQNATDEKLIHLFVRYCIRLVQLKEEGLLTEEEASYRMLGASQFDTLANSPDCDEIFDFAGIVELPRTTSYAQPLQRWDEHTANQIKQKQWKGLVTAIEKAKKSVSTS